MDPFRFPSHDGQALQQLSPERVNGIRPVSAISTTTSRSTKYSESESQDFHASPQSSPTRKARAALFADPASPSKVSGFALPQSPSLPEIHSLRSHVRTNSDVQGLVKRFEHLDVRDKDAETIERMKRHEAELRRAQIAREEAESDVKRLREEMRRLKKEGEESRERERKVAKRLDLVMEEFGAAKEAHGSQHSVYEKELRKARKEAFKSLSTVLKLQEELKSTRNSLRITQSGFDLEKQKVERKEQERFEMEYQLIPLQEQLDQLKEKLRTAEEEREALKTNLREEEVARIAAEGMIALPASQDMDMDLMSSPRKQPTPQKLRLLNDPEEDKENMGAVSRKASENRHLSEELRSEKIRREHAEELVDFLRIECMFQCCGCRSASRLGHEFTLELDAEMAAGVEKIRAGMEGILSLQHSSDEKDRMEVDDEVVKAVDDVEHVVEPEAQADLEQMPDARHAMDDDLDRSLTFAAESPKQPQASDEHVPEVEEAALSGLLTGAEEEVSAHDSASETRATVQPQHETSTEEEDHHQTTPVRPHALVRTVTTTTTIPMHFTPVSKHLPPVFDPEDAENIPPTSNATLPDGTQPTFDRAAALAAIEYRRGRAKSIANGQATPRKQMMEGIKGRRDISAPALGQKRLSVSAGKGPRSVRGMR
ncbi:hypothetical protein LTR37_013515 [Vermiconidia calcicola]|uniref:Uncharacterized protein n=1 Tax=Vermiconidia calcicola TaxID=1690605 RepID=A0ACC3MWA0_9PEZI|nr:hypothetical protein LTR37_013515 [Vermiconidia calcicola]